jgi:hypothetical protein
MKKHIQIKDSYNTWNPKEMKGQMKSNSLLLIIEWWIHNICYYLTLPFVKLSKGKELNERCKHVDLMVDDIDTMR